MQLAPNSIEFVCFGFNALLIMTCQLHFPPLTPKRSPKVSPYCFFVFNDGSWWEATGVIWAAQRAPVPKQPSAACVSRIMKSAGNHPISSNYDKLSPPQCSAGREGRKLKVKPGGGNVHHRDVPNGCLCCCCCYCFYLVVWCPALEWTCSSWKTLWASAIPEVMPITHCQSFTNLIKRADRVVVGKCRQ